MRWLAGVVGVWSIRLGLGAEIGIDLQLIRARFVAVLTTRPVASCATAVQSRLQVDANSGAYL